MRKYQLVLTLLLITKLCIAQEYLLKNEEVIFSFITNKGKKMVLAKDKDNEYIIYRFGTEKKIELEYPEKNRQSWSKFTYFYYGKPGGTQNGGSYFHSVHFKIDDFQYAIFSNVYVTDDSEDDYHQGILITNTKTNKRKKILAYKSIEGTIDDFQNSNLLQFDDIQNYE